MLKTNQKKDEQKEMQQHQFIVSQCFFLFQLRNSML